MVSQLIQIPFLMCCFSFYQRQKTSIFRRKLCVLININIRLINGLQLEYYTLYNIETILYKKLNLLCPESIQYQREKSNLKAYNNILSRSIRIAKKDYFINEFEKYKNDIRKTWDTFKSILNKSKVKSKFPNFFSDKWQARNRHETDCQSLQ